jgi:hypothetical protein
MNDERLSVIHRISAILLQIALGGLIWHSLVNSKPYKIVYLDGYYWRLAYIGVPAAIVLSSILVLVVRKKVPGYFLPPMSPALLSLVLWAIYKVSFFLAGHNASFETFFEFSTLSAEMDLAYLLLQLMSYGVIVGVAISVVSEVVFKKRMTP